jgi:hypothetical protein
MDEKEIGLVWAEYYPKSGDNRDARQMNEATSRAGY